MCYYIRYRIQYRIQYRVRCLMCQFEQGGLLPALDRDAADVITGSEHILKRMQISILSKPQQLWNQCGSHQICLEKS
jgi:hypothetical protein